MCDGVLIEGIRYENVLTTYSLEGGRECHRLLYADVGGPKFAIMPRCSFFVASDLINQYLEHVSSADFVPINPLRLRDTISGGFLRLIFGEITGYSDVTIVGAIEPRKPLITSHEFYRQLEQLRERVAEE